jgi:hypothetical protein
MRGCGSREMCRLARAHQDCDAQRSPNLPLEESSLRSSTAVSACVEGGHAFGGSLWPPKA